MLNLWKNCKSLWHQYGWHILLSGLFLALIILFIINMYYNDTTETTTISWQDIYEHFISLFFRPAVAPVAHRRPRSQTSSKGEMGCKEFIEFYFQKPFVKIRPDFLKNPITQENLELDLYNDELKLAIEYNGSQHYHYNSFMHKNSRDKFQNQQYRDLIKKDLCQKAGIRLIIVPYTIPQDQIAAFLFDEFKRLDLHHDPNVLN